MSGELEREFELEMRRLYVEPKRLLGYDAGYFRQMLSASTAVDVARRLVLDRGISEGLTRLWEEGALDLSVEALVLREPWRLLFDGDILLAAERKLRKLGYEGLEPEA